MRRVVRSLVAALVPVVVGAGACTRIAPEESAVAGAVTPTPSVAPALTAADLTSPVAALEDEHGTRLALAWAPTGRPEGVQTVGVVGDLQAWSTIKVPIAVAAARTAGGTANAATAQLMRRAITVSDNDAAAALWRSLGSPEAAGAAVDAVLREAGDPTTRAGRDATGRAVSFGLTTWTVPDAARFSAGLPCVADPLTLRLMGEIDDDHAWGLGTVPGARFKGGWGPSPGGYLVRQIGVLQRPDGSTVGVAMAARPADDDHARATRALGAVARLVAARVGPADAGRCAG